MDKQRADTQQIRDLLIGVLNLMPNREETERQLFRVLSSAPLHINPVLIRPTGYQARHTSADYFEQHYIEANQLYDTSLPTESQVRLDGLIITGADIEKRELSDIDYYQELLKVMDWSRQNVASTLHLCWAAQIRLYEKFGLRTHKLPEKMFGVFKHVRRDCKLLLRGMDEGFDAPHSRHRHIETDAIESHPDLDLLAWSAEAGPHIMATPVERAVIDDQGTNVAVRKEVMVLGHPEYDALALKKEYLRDRPRGAQLPKNYFPGNDENATPVNTWSANGHLLYQNWINMVYQATPYDLWADIKNKVDDKGPKKA